MVVESVARFPFGVPVSRCAPSASSPRRVFVLGAYPSALHVAWLPPKPFERVRALPVADEPEPFWTGTDEALRIAAWRERVGFRDAWGAIATCRRLNGSSGVWVEERVLRPLGVSREECWITDCLATYRTSTDVAKRLDDTYHPFAAAHGAPVASLSLHPSERQIVREALAVERERLTAELELATPELVVTLGNAALRVLRALVLDADGIQRLAADDRYGTARRVRVMGRTASWVPLAHPAAPRAYQLAHAAWVERRERVPT